MEIKGEASVLIQAPPGVVYDYLLDFTAHPEWVANLRKVWKVLDGPVGPGARFQAQEWAPPVPLARRLLSMLFFMAGVARGAQTVSEAEITAVEPGRRIAWTGRVPRPGGDFNRVDWEIILEPAAAGTRVTQRFEYLPGTGAARRMVSALGAARGIEDATAVSLGRLKALLEQRQRQPA